MKLVSITIFVLLSIGVRAQELSESLEPVRDVITPIIRELNVIVGGIFGLYVILIAVRIYYERRKIRMLHDIRYNLDQLNKHYNLNYSGSRRGWITRGWKSVFRWINTRQTSRHIKKTARK